MPVTFKMVSEASVGMDDVLQVDGKPVQEIFVVGRVITRHAENMRVIFEVHDGTGASKVIFYQKGQHDTPSALRDLNFEMGMYVRIYGQIRVFREERAVVGTKVEAITDYNEITGHFLKVFTAACVRKDGVKIQEQNIKGASKADLGQMVQSQTYSQGTATLGMNSATLQEAILNTMQVIRKKCGSNFVNIDDVWTAVQNKMSKPQLQELLKELEGDGSIYQAGNESTYCITD